MSALAEPNKKMARFSRLTLEVAGGVLFFTGKCYLRTLLAEQICNLRICNITDLVVVVDKLAVLIADTILPRLH